MNFLFIIPFVMILAWLVSQFELIGEANKNANESERNNISVSKM